MGVLGKALALELDESDISEFTDAMTGPLFNLDKTTSVKLLGVMFGCWRE